MLEIAAPPLKYYTTIKLGGPALALLKPEHPEELGLLEEKAAQWGGDLMPIGRGSNLLATDGQLPLILVSLERIQGIEIIKREGGKIKISAYAGTPLPRLLRFCLKNGFTGLEGLAGIPGSVGGACAMNAGSFGTTIGAHVEAIYAWNGREICLFEKESLSFGYRSLKIKNIKQIPIITRIILTLTEAPKSVIFASMNLNFLNKKSRQPITAYSAGCTFKNPSDAPAAGQLLEQAGLRGYRLGGMEFSRKHANFLVNTGTGTGFQALELIDKASEAVWKCAGIRLEPEIRILSWQ